MSRIEKALEKAAMMRDALQVPADTSHPSTGHETGEGEATLEDLSGTTEAGGATMSIDPSRVDRHIVCITEPFGVVAEEYKKLRARILNATKEAWRNTIMVTSPGVGEGKTVTATNLAVALAAEIDQRVLLVDADLRNPTVHRCLGIEPKAGLADYLVGRAELSDLFMKTDIGRLSLLPAGEPPENPAELISSERMKSLVHQLKHQYKDRYVIFDSPPMLVAADALSLSRYMDGIVLVLQATRSMPSAAQQTLSLIKDRTVLGVVFNNVPQYLAASHYSPYYYRGGRQDDGRRSGNGKK